MKTFSLCMIVRDEEDVIGRCLDSVKDIVDEIVIVDTGSVDRTKEICARYTKRLYDFAWIRDFAAARNESFAHATGDYLLWLDADDVILPADAERFRWLKTHLTDEDVVFCKYHTSFDDKGAPAFSFYRERLLRREAGFRWEGRVHECIPPRGKLLYCDAAVCHRKLRPADPRRNLSILAEIADSGTMSPRERYYYAREMYDNGEYSLAAEQLEIFLAEGLGWKVNNVEAGILLADCYRRTAPQKRLPALLATLAYDVPRAELCCALGDAFFAAERWEEAAFWYENARRDDSDPAVGGFRNPACRDLIPLLQLCVCCDRLGRRREAEQYNLMAAELRPDHPSVRHNLDYFRRLPS